MIKELISNQKVNERIAELGREITDFYKDRPLTVITLLNGGMFFGADLIRKIDMQLTIDTMALASYEEQKSTGIATLRSQLKKSVGGRDLLVVDDILDTGLSIKYTMDYLKKLHPASIRTCVLLNKINPKRPPEIKTDWYGFEIPDKFVVGFGLDYNELYRNLPFIGVVEPD